MKKSCTKCNRVLSATLVYFYKSSDGKYGLRSICKECCRKQKNKYYIKNRGYILNREKEYKENNKNKIKEYNKQYYLDNKEKRLKYNKKHYHNNVEKEKERRKKYYFDNKEKYVACVAKRRAIKLQATPDWLTEEHLEDIEWCYWLAGHDSENLHVDHIVPLQGNNVCGLHVPWNLRVILAKDNLSKSNKFIASVV